MLTTLAVLALVLATVALLYARRQAREVARLKEMYWQLKYEHGELKATLAPPPGPPAQTSFVPLGAVKRNSP